VHWARGGSMWDWNVGTIWYHTLSFVSLNFQPCM
jgi:hypothetical protein